MGELLGIARFTFHEGKVDEYKRLTEECIRIVREQDTGTLQYDIYFTDDESEAVVVERYRDSQALLEHLEHIGHLMEPILATVADGAGETLGDANDEVRAKMAEAGVRVLTPWQSMGQ